MSLYATPPGANLTEEERRIRHAQLMYLIGIGDGGLPSGPAIDPRISFWAPLVTTLVPTVGGNKTFTFQRATSPAYVRDHENILRQAQAGEARFQGARRVRNWVTGNSQDCTNGAWTKAGTTPSYGATGPTGLPDATTLTATSGNGSAYQLPTGAVGITAVTSYWIRRRTGTGAIKLIDANSTQVDLTAQIDGTWRRLSLPPTVVSGTAAIGVVLIITGDAVDITYMQFEQVNGQSNQAPGDYVSVGVLAAPYHGVGNTVDGIKCFATTNGNSVPGANLCLQSQTFDNATAWPPAGFGGTITADAVAAPDGTTTADRFNATAVNEPHGRYQTIAPATGTFSIYAKAGTHNFLIVDLLNLGTSGANFNLATGTIGFVNAGVTAAIQALPNGWYRCSVTGAYNYPEFYLGQNGTANTRVWLAAGTETVYLWGAQVEPGLYATGYNPTTTAAVPAGNVVTEATGTLIPAATLLGYVAENAATNLCPQSQTFDVAPWGTNNNSIAANDAAAPAPDGTITADRFTDTATNTSHALGSGASATSGAPITFSVYVKAGTLTWMQLVQQTGSNFWANFNIQTGVVGSKAAGVTSAIQSLPNGWYRCSMTLIAGAATNSIFIASLSADTASFLPPYIGTGQTMYLWGAQVEASSDPSSYIPTTTAAVVRATDNLQYPMTSNLNGALATTYNETYMVAANPGHQTMLSFGGTPGQYYDTTSKQLVAISPAGALVTSNARVLGAVNKNAVAWNGATGSACLNGSAVVTGAFATFPTSGNIFVGIYSGGTNVIQGSIRNVKFYSVRIADADLITMTA